MNKKASLISLFAGAGGLDIGLEQAGFDSLVVSELANHACETLRQNKALSRMSLAEFDSWFEEQLAQRCYSKISREDAAALKTRLRSAVGKRPILNHAEVLEGDIRTVSSAKFMEAAGVAPGELTLVAGGPPCQPFSRAGKRHTVEAEDGRLFLEFVRVVRDVKPRWFLLENVKGLAQSKTVVPYAVCSKCSNKTIIPFEQREAALSSQPLELAKCKICDGAHHEVELKEERGGSLSIILAEFESIGYKCSHDILNSADFGVPQSRERLFIVGSRDGEKFVWPTPTHFSPASISKAAQKNARQLSLIDEQCEMQAHLTVKDVLWKNGHPQFGRLDLNKAQLWVKNVVRPHAEAVTWSLDRPSPTVGAHQAAKLAIAPYGVPPEQLARQQWHTLGKRQRDLPPVFVEHAMLSDEDLLRLQTFPPDWYLFGTRMERAFQIGNAVPPILGKVMGEAILSSSKDWPTISAPTYTAELA